MKKRSDTWTRSKQVTQKEIIIMPCQSGSCLNCLFLGNIKFFIFDMDVITGPKLSSRVIDIGQCLEEFSIVPRFFKPKFNDIHWSA